MMIEFYNVIFFYIYLFYLCWILYLFILYLLIDMGHQDMYGVFCFWHALPCFAAAKQAKSTLSREQEKLAYTDFEVLRQTNQTHISVVYPHLARLYGTPFSFLNSTSLSLLLSISHIFVFTSLKFMCPNLKCQLFSDRGSRLFGKLLAHCKIDPM